MSDSDLWDDEKERLNKKSSSVEVLRKRNWKCNDCGEFCWSVARSATKKEISKASEFVEWADENMEVYEYPKNEDEWRVAVLYCGENIYEMSEAIDNCLDDFCDKCQKKLVKYGVFEKENDDDE